MYLAAAALMAYETSAQSGGPPMLTEDPAVADVNTWELNTSINPHISDVFELTLPNLDLNYGVVRDLQFHLGVPYQFVFSQNKLQSGFGNLELGVKFHFLHEEDHFISIGTHPILEFTGDKIFTFPLLLHKRIGRFLIGDALTAVWSSHRGWRNGFLVGYTASEKTNLMIEYFFEKMHDGIAAVMVL